MSDLRANYSKSISDIINHHIDVNNMPNTHDDMMAALAKAVQAGYQLIRFNNVLFAAHVNSGGRVFFSMVNGDDTMNYVKAIRKFINFFKQQGVHQFQIYVQDIASSEHVAKAAGLHNIEIVDSGLNQVDPYLLTGEA